MSTLRLALITLALVSGSGAQAGQLDAIASCYTQLKLPAPKPQTELFVVIDQTTLLDATLKQALANQVKPFIRAGNAFSVMQFSAYTQGRYLDVLTAARLDTPLTPELRNDTGKNQLQQFDRCLQQQQTQAAQLAGSALRNALSGSSDGLAKSDVLSSLKEIASKVRQSPAGDKVVLISSDMLENSSISSFYNSKAVRLLDPQKELRQAESAGLVGNFGGARIYVQGAGLVSEAGQSKGVYRDPKTMQALQQFWRHYFQRANAKLVEFGQPALLNQVQ